MEVSYRHANPRGGNESFLLRFDGRNYEQTPCVLVDSGKNVDVDDLLDEDDYLAAVLVTHAHLDHYRTLGENLRDGAPVHAAPDTARILERVLAEGERHRDLGDTDAVADALEPTEGWTTVIGDLGLRVHPVPAGHAPGAAGFLLEFEDTDPHHLLATGDFTMRRAAGYPGFDPDGLDVDVETVFLTGATAEGVEETLTDVVGTAIERARAGSTVLLTAGGLLGVHLAYLLGHVGERVDGPQTTLVGQAAKLHDQLDYDVPRVESVPSFESPTEVLASGEITIAGPEVPVDGSAARLFGQVSDDPGATLLQATSGGIDPVDSAECTVYVEEISNHPTDATLDAVVGALDPAEVVITHQSSRASNRFKDRYDSLVWATDDDQEYLLYDDGWQGPPWVHEGTTESILAEHFGPRLDAPDSLALPTRGGVDLAAEGLDVRALDDRLETGTVEPTTGDPADETADPAIDCGSSATRAITDGAAASASTDAEPGTVTLAEVRDRLAAVERAVAGPTVRARVVDAGDGLTLLRVLDGNDALAEAGSTDGDLADGDVIELALRGASQNQEGED